MKTLVLLYPGCIAFEVLLACELLNSKFPVEIVTLDGNDHVASNGMIIKSSKALSGASPADYKVALFPGGDPEAVIGNTQLNQFIQSLNSNQSILAAICAGPVILDQAGVLAHKKIAHGYKGTQLEWLIEKGFFKNVSMTDHLTVTEGNIVTARPEAFIDFAVQVAVLCCSIENAKVQFWKDYYKGSAGVKA